MYTRHHWILSYREISFVLRSVALAKLFPRQQNCRWGKCHSRTVSRFSRTWNKAKSMNYSSLLNGESQSKNRVFFVNANNNLPLSLATHRSSSLQSAGFPYEIRLQRSLKFEPWLLPPFWTVLSSQAAFSCTQYQNTARKIGTFRNTVSKIGQIPIPHLDPFTIGHA